MEVEWWLASLHFKLFKLSVSGGVILSVLSIVISLWFVHTPLHTLTLIFCMNPIGKCLDRSDLLHKVFTSDCDTSKTTQKWEMNNIVAVWYSTSRTTLAAWWEIWWLYKGGTHTHTKKYNHYFRRISNRYCPFKETILGIFSSQCHLQHWYWVLTIQQLESQTVGWYNSLWHHGHSRWQQKGYLLWRLMLWVLARTYWTNTEL